MINPLLSIICSLVLRRQKQQETKKLAQSIHSSPRMNKKSNNLIDSFEIRVIFMEEHHRLDKKKKWKLQSGSTNENGHRER